MIGRNTVGEILTKVVGTENQIFEAAIPGLVESEYFAVGYKWDFGAMPIWENKPEFGTGPWVGSRRKPRTSVTNFRDAKFSVKSRRKKLVDFYTESGGTFLISEKLRNLIETASPGSLETVKVGFIDYTPAQDYFLCAPTLLLEAIDTSKTKVSVNFKVLAGQTFRDIRFPKKVVLDHERTAGALHFADIDIVDWLWSRELIELAEAAGIKGQYYGLAGDANMLPIFPQDILKSR